MCCGKKSNACGEATTCLRVTAVRLSLRRARTTGGGGTPGIHLIGESVADFSRIPYLGTRVRCSTEYRVQQPQS